MFYSIFICWSTYNPTIFPVFTSVHKAKPVSEGKQWKLKEPNQVLSPFFTLSCHCLNEKPHCYVTSFCEKHYIERPSESQCPTENPLLNWDKLFLKCLITVWFSDLYILHCSKDIHNIKTQRAHGLHLSTWFFLEEHECRRYQTVASYYSIISASASFEVKCLVPYSWIASTGLQRKDEPEQLSIRLIISTCLTIFFHFQWSGGIFMLNLLYFI